MIATTLTALDLDELTQRQDVQIDELRNRLQGVAVITRLSEISDGGRLRLDSADVDAPRKELQPREMLQIVDRAMLMLSSFYVHLAAKRALYANDPLQALRNLKAQLGANPSRVGEEEFHARMTAIFVSLRDRHTNYYLPAPYRETLVFLPFLIEATWDDDAGKHRYLVTKLAWTPCADDVVRAAQEGESPVEVTHVNGMAIEHVVARNGEESAGANRAARHARGVDRLTFRWLGLGTGPREDWVDLRVSVDDQTYERRFEWLAAQQFQRRLPAGGNRHATGHDLEGEWIREVRQALYVREAADRPARRPSPFAYSTHQEPGGGPQYGYLRIFTFDVGRAGVPRFLARIAGILRRAPEAGLIIDIRGNPGGDVLAAEGLLQLFSAPPVACQGIQFLNTPDAAKLGDAVFKGVMDTPAQYAQATAASFVVLPRMPRAGIAPGEQAYQGPVVLIVDANCYSASEMFAAGMQDNGLARVIGTHEQTGGGGGILWSDERIAKECDDRELRKRLERLPGGASFDVAVLRTTRTGERAGAVVEDMGVVVPTDDVHRLTREDVLGSNDGLLAFASKTLARMAPKPLVSARYARGRYRLAMRDLDRIDVRVDAVHVARFGSSDMPATYEPPETGHVEFRGFSDDELVTSYRPRRRSPRSTAPPPAASPGAQDREV